VGPFRVRYSSRGILNSLLVYSGIPAEQSADVFRVLDKLDKIGAKKVRLELTTGYVDASGDPIAGVGLAEEQVDKIERFLKIPADDRREVVAQLRDLFAGVEGAEAEIAIVERISSHLYSLGYGDDQVSLDLSIARGLAYYTGPVFEAALTFETLDEKGKPRQFGSVAGGGRYDDLVRRFTNQDVPACGASIGVDRLLAALRSQRSAETAARGPVVVTVMDRDRLPDYQAMVDELRAAGIRAELYQGTQNFQKQMKYADKRSAPVAVIAGGDEFAAGEVQIKDLVAGAERSKEITDRDEWRTDRSAQRTVARDELVAVVRAIVAP
jgi:histidyl-tRNA synthetase